MYRIQTTCNGEARSCYEVAGIATGGSGLDGLFDAPADNSTGGDVDADFGWDSMSVGPVYTSFSNVSD